MSSVPKTRILFVTANLETCPLDASEELEAIKSAVAKSDSKFHVEALLAANTTRLEERINNYDPHIIHFSVHGGEIDSDGFAKTIGFLNERADHPHWITIEALVDYFRSVIGSQRSLKLVVFNSCYSLRQAEQVAEVVGFAIGAEEKTFKRCSTTFSESFYRNLTTDNLDSAVTRTTKKMELDGALAVMKLCDPYHKAVEFRFSASVGELGIPKDLSQVSDTELFDCCLKIVQHKFTESLSDESLAVNILAPRLDIEIARQFLIPDLVSTKTDGFDSKHSLDEILLPDAKTLIVGKSGMGKSTLLRYLGKMAIVKRLLPVLVDLREYVVPSEKSKREPWEYTTAKLISMFTEIGTVVSHERIKSNVLGWAIQGKLFIAVDSIDEAQPETFVKYLSQHIDSSHSPLAVTCRFQDFRESLISLGLLEVQIRSNRTEFEKFLRTAFPEIDDDTCKIVIDHELAESPMGLQLLIRGKLLGAEPQQFTHSEKYQFKEELKETRSSKHINRVADFLINPDSEKSGLAPCPEAIREFPLRHIAQIIALHYLYRAGTDDKLNQTVAQELVRACLDNFSLQCRSSTVMEYFKDRKLINIGFGDNVWFLHDFLAQALANSLKGSTGFQDSIRFKENVEVAKKQVYDMQGHQIQSMRALFFRLTHRGAIKDVLIQMQEVPDAIWTKTLHEIQAPKTISSGTSLTIYLETIVSIVAHFRNSYMKAPDFPRRLEVMESSLRQLLELEKTLPQSGQNVGFEDPRKVLFIEYVLGLGYFEIIGILGEAYLSWIGTHLERNYSNASSYADGLDEVFQIQAVAAKKVEELSGGPPEETWFQLAEFYRSHIPETAKTMLNCAIGIRYVPQQRALMSIAQMLHWDGWGGNGQTCDLVFQKQTDSLSKVLAKHRSISIDWHGIGTAKNGKDEPGNLTTNFSPQQKMFGNVAKGVKDYAAKCGAAILVSPHFGQENSDHFAIWGDAVGPRFVAEQDLVSAIRSFVPRAKNPKFELTLTEMSGPSLDRLFDEIDKCKKENGKIYSEITVYYRDLNLEFMGEPSRRSAEASRYYNQFDAYSCAISLHQVADQFLGHQRINEILGFATYITRPGGLISIPDVGCGINLQAFLIPINLVDREGGWGLDVFSSTIQRNPLCKFRDVMSDNPGSTKFKVPIPIVSLAAGTPLRCAEIGLAVYETIPYLVIELPEESIDSLQSDWDRAKSIIELEQVVNHYVTLWKPTATGWLDGIKQKLIEHQMSHSICPKVYVARFGLDNSSSNSSDQPKL